MGMAMYQETGYKRPAWSMGYPNLAHCKNCDAVFNKTTEFIRVVNVSKGTLPAEHVKVGNCKSGCCPICDTPVESD